MIFNRFGKLVVRAFSAGGAIPISGATVIVRGAGEENRDVTYSLITDIDGVTEEISLPAPDALYSQSPGATETPYGLYDVYVSAKDYYTKTVKNVAVFDGVRTTLPVNMIPKAIHDNNVTYPRDNLNTVIFDYEE